jgi:hypothetical protein
MTPEPPCTERTDVLVLGGAGVDTVVHVPELPLPYADSYPIRPGIRTRAGQTGDFVALAGPPPDDRSRIVSAAEGARTESRPWHVPGG